MTTTKIHQNLLVQVDKLFRHNRQGSYKTRERYRESMMRFCTFLAREYRLERLANIAPKHIEAYVSHMQTKGLAASTIKTDLAAIRFWHDQMPRPRHKLPDNSQLDLARRTFGRVDRRWLEVEFHHFIGVCWRHQREDYAAVACLARHAGLRIHECFRLDTAAARQALQTMALTVKGKGGKSRTVSINDTIRIELEKLLAATPRGHKLFVPGGIPTDRAIESLQRFILEHRSAFQAPETQTPLTFHGLRHTYAAEQYLLCRQRGLSDMDACRTVSHLLGHERPDVTRIYLAGLDGDAE